MTLEDKIIHSSYDLVILGAGGAGIAAGLYASAHNLSIAILSKVHPLHSHTSAAQGGINAALDQVADNWRWHMYDTVKGSDWLGDQDAIEIMCSNAPAVIQQLEKWGVSFDRDINGCIDQKTYGGQTTNFGHGALARRVCSVADKTGDAIMTALYKRSIENGIQYLNYHYATDLIVEDNKVHGVISIDIENGTIHIIQAPKIIIATGGYSQVYHTSTSSNICSGDGNGIAFRAGIGLQDMEFVQFHPTAINNIGVLITEASRSLGGKLINGLGQRFMSQYAPDLMELACRDLVSRAISKEISLGNGCGEAKDHVLLDLTHITRQQFDTNLPNVFYNCQTFLDIDPTKAPIPVSPAAHYTMGGIPTNVHTQVITVDSKGDESVIDGLYAIGEAACVSVHGANRLGCNSLLDLMVFAKVASEHIAQNLVTTSQHNLFDQRKYAARLANLFGQTLSTMSVTDIKASIKMVMHKYVGVFRNETLLSRGIDELSTIKHHFERVKISSTNLIWNNELIELLEVDNLLISAQCTIRAAIAREESRGAHYREDFDIRDDDQFLYHSIITPYFEYFKRPVRMNTQYVDFFPPGQRNY